MSEKSLITRKSDHVFDIYSKYYDLLYSDKDYAGEVDYIANLLTSYGLTKSRVLEFGSGTGKHGSMLGEMGHSVTGIELSHEMVKISQKTANFECIQGDITSITLHKAFDCVLSLFHVVSYLVSNEQINALFANANKHLLDKGLFIFDVWYGPSVNCNQPSIRVKRMGDAEIELVRIAEPESFPDENRVDVNYTIFARPHGEQSWSKIQETHSMRYFSTPEIDLLARANGFEVLRVEEFKSGKQPDFDTWGVCYVLRKI